MFHGEPCTPAPQAGDTLRVRVKRCDPSQDEAARFETFDVPWSRDMRVIDALNHIYEEQGADIGYRWYCGTKKCGTCAVRVNGRETLACWEAAQAEMTVEPLRHLPLVRDLAVDRAPFEDKLAALGTWLQRDHAYTGFPERIEPAATQAMRPAMDCISCLACYSACPVLDFEGAIPFAGPAPLVHLARVALDPRDGGNRARDMAAQAHLFNCVSCYKCEEVCPVHIPIVSAAIEPLKRMATAAKAPEAAHAIVFTDIVRERGRIEPMLLVARVRGLGALRDARKALRLVLRGKINPLRALFGRAIPSIRSVRNYFAARN